MKYIILIIITIIFAGCKECKEKDLLDRNTNFVISISCNHSEDYSFCDNLDTALVHFNEVKQLIIYRKVYSALPADISKLVNLCGLTLKNQPNINWADAFNKLSVIDSISSIDIDNCRIGNLTNIHKLKNLKLLTIYDKQTSSFPRELSKCQNLVELNLICPIIDVPDNLVELRNLKKLTITIAAKVFPKSLTALPSLEYLDIGGEIEEIPIDVSNLSKLESLSLYDTPLGREELNYYRKHNTLNKLKIIKRQMSNCEFILEPPLPPL